MLNGIEIMKSNALMSSRKISTAKTLGIVFDGVGSLSMRLIMGKAFQMRGCGGKIDFSC